MLGNLTILRDDAQLGRRVAWWITDLAAASSGKFRIALSGGSTPEPIYRLLGQEPFKSAFPWARVHWYWGDERIVSHDDPASNFGMAREAFLSKVPVPSLNIHPVETKSGVQKAALAYEDMLRADYASDTLDPDRPFFDIMLLGMGDDGHTASLMPGSIALDERERWVVGVSGERPEARITLSYPLIESAQHVGFVVKGANKTSALQKVAAGDKSLPAARVRPSGDVIWFTDEAAAAKISDAGTSAGEYPPVLLVMGVSGSGKTTVGKALAQRLGWTFQEGDDLHPEENVKKMHAGIPLTDRDRQPWLQALRDWIEQQHNKGRPGVISCSILKRSYRDFLNVSRPGVHLLYLRGSQKLFAKRLAERQGHFMPAALLKSQFEALEIPQIDESVIVIDARPLPGVMVDETIAQLRGLGLAEREKFSPEGSGISYGQI